MNKKHIVVVGGTKGIGRTIANLFAANGAVVSIVGLSPQPVKQNKKISITGFQADISKPPEVKSLVNSIVKTNGKISNVIFSQRFRGSGDDWQGEIDVSMSATRNIIEQCLDKYDDTQEKSIVVVGSVINTFISLDQPLSYHTGKAALLALVRYYAVTLGHLGIRVNCVSPGAVFKERAREYYEKNKTLYKVYGEVIPLQRMGTPEDIANVVIYLCGSNSLYITGQNIVVDGGLSLLAQEGLTKKVTSLLQKKENDKK